MKRGKPKVYKRYDMFCGGGGASMGGDLAFDEKELRYEGFAINHWDIAVATYNANHPNMQALCMNVENANVRKLFHGADIDYLWASPTCTFYSRARGGKPTNDQERSQPYLVTTVLHENIVRHVTIENVPEIVGWTQVGTNGKPLKSQLKVMDAREVGGVDGGKIKVGLCFKAWVESIRACNYDVEWKIVNCADYGDATTRKRFFLKAVRKGCGRIVWPEPTHAQHPGSTLFNAGLKPWKGINACIDKSDLGKSIFGRKKPLAANTLRRIAVGLKKYNGIEFQMDMLGADKGDESRVRLLADPLPPQHAGGNRSAVVRPFIVKLNNGANAESIDEPLTSVLAGGQHHALCTPFIVRANKGCFAESVDKPLSSQQASTVHHAICTPIVLDHFKNGEAQDVGKPIGAQTTHDRYSVVTPFIVEHRKNGGAKPIDGPIGAQTTKDKFSVCTPYIVNNNAHNVPTGMDEPVHSQTTGNHAMLCTPLVLGQQSGSAARPVDAPCPAISCSGALQLATPMILDMSRPGGHDSGHIRSADEPIQSITSCDAIQVATPMIVDMSHPGEENDAGRVSSADEPLKTITTSNNLAVVNLPRLPDGRYLDIRIRMLKPSELAAAHSFPKGYVFKGNRTEQVKQIGNSVPVMTAYAMYKADLEAS